MTSLNAIKTFRETNINKYFRKLHKGADNNIHEYITELRNECRCSYDEDQIFDEKQINFYKKRSVDPKNCFSMNYMSYLYYEGIHVKQNIEMSIELAKELVKNDLFGYGSTKLGYIYTHAPEFKDSVKALEFTKMGCEKKNRYALLHMGEYYELGLNGLEQNLDKAIEWYKIGIEHGSIQCKNNLAHIYLHKLDKISEAKALYTEIINDDYSSDKARAFFKLGYILHVIEDDKDEALKFYKKCIDFCHEKKKYYHIMASAANNVANIYYERSNLIESRKMYELSIKFINPIIDSSCRKLGDMYLHGKGGDVNIIQAIFCYCKATLYNTAWRLITERINDNEFLNELTDVLSYDDFRAIYCDFSVPMKIYKLLEAKRLANIQIEI